MKRACWVVCVLGTAILFGGALSGDDRPTARGSLPQHWRKLGLSDDQKQKVYSIQAEYRQQIAKLRQQLRDLVKRQQAEMEKVLTPAQKTRLREILTERAPKEETTPKEKGDKKGGSK